MAKNSVTIRVKKDNVSKAAQDFAKVVRDETEKETRKRIAKYGKRVFSRVNKKIDRLIASGYVSPALEGLLKTHSKHFTIGGKNIDELQREINKALIFESRQTSNISGARAYTNQLKNLLGERIDDNDYISNIFDLMHGIEERIPISLAKNMGGTDTILNDLIERYTQSEISAMSEADREEKITEQLNRIQKQIQRETSSGLGNIRDSFTLR